MKQTIGKVQFINAFKDAGLSGRFTRNGLSALFDYVTEIEQRLGLEIDLDLDAICDQYEQFKSYVAMAKARFPLLIKPTEEYAKRYAQAHLTTVEFEGGVIISNSQT